MVKRMPTLAGLSPWVLMDFHSPRRCCRASRATTNAKVLSPVKETAKKRSTYCKSSIAPCRTLQIALTREFLRFANVDVAS